MTESSGGKKRLGFMDSPAGPAETKALWADFEKSAAAEDQPEDSLGDIYYPFETAEMKIPAMPEEVARVVDGEINARFEAALGEADTEEKRNLILEHRKMAVYIAARRVTSQPHGIPGIILCNLSMLDSSPEAQEAYLREAVRTNPKKDKSAPHVAKFIASRMLQGRLSETLLGMVRPELMALVDDVLAEDVAKALAEPSAAKKKSPPKPS